VFVLFTCFVLFPSIFHSLHCVICVCIVCMFCTILFHISIIALFDGDANISLSVGGVTCFLEYTEEVVTFVFPSAIYVYGVVGGR
jgi:hypothetical protein